jgi:hypothetical protein
MRWSKGLWVGLSGTSLALAVGCSHGAGAEAEATESAAATAATTADAEAGEKPAWSDERSDDAAKTEASRIEDRSSPGGSVAATDANGASPWFLRPPGSPDPNAPIQSASDVRPESPKPIVSPQTRPIQTQPNPRPKGNWSIRAACGRG